jgi:signal transduction histidine kinase
VKSSGHSAGLVTAAVVVLAAICWLSLRIVEFDRQNREGRIAAEREERIRLALWRMDSELAPLIAKESAHSLLYTEKEGTAQALAEHGCIWPGQKQGESDQVLFYFDNDPNSAVKPAAPLANQSHSKLLSSSKVGTALKSFGGSVAANEPPGQATNATINQVQQQLQQAEAQSAQEFSNRYSNVQKAITSQAFDGRDLPKSGALQPIWLDDQLVLAREDDTRHQQGAVLNWPLLEKTLLGRVADLLPEASLRPVRPGFDLDVHHRLASIPVILAPGNALPGLIIEASPVRMVLGIAWTGVALAFAAATLLIAGSLRLSARRAEFVSAVTHELRTPITTLRLYADMLGEGMVDAQKAREYLGTMRAEADRLGQLVDNVLAFSRLERNPGALRDELVTVGKLFETMIPRLEHRAAQSGMRLVPDLAGIADRYIVVDPQAVEHVVFNLVDNACKYASNAADLRIHIDGTYRNGAIRISVRDHGSGIHDSVRRRLFLPFSKPAQAGSSPGVGLGLALCRQLAKRFKGSLSYESSSGGPGAVLVLTLPTSTA